MAGRARRAWLEPTIPGLSAHVADLKADLIVVVPALLHKLAAQFLRRDPGGSQRGRSLRSTHANATAGRRTCTCYISALGTGADLFDVVCGNS
jgi:hypothetical protein